MSSARNASAITSLPKPGALTPAGVGRSTPATAGSASLPLARAVAERDGVIALFLWWNSFGNLLGGRSYRAAAGVWRRHPTGSLRNAQGALARSSADHEP